MVGGYDSAGSEHLGTLVGWWACEWGVRLRQPRPGFDQEYPPVVSARDEHVVLVDGSEQVGVVLGDGATAAASERGQQQGQRQGQMGSNRKQLRTMGRHRRSVCHRLAGVEASQLLGVCTAGRVHFCGYC